MTRLPIGRRIRDRRKQRGLTQRALAESVGISAAYLNLIEHDKRAIGGTLLKRIAQTLGVEIGRLSGSEDAQLAQDVQEMSRSLELPGLDGESAARFVAVSPEWATAFRSLHRRYLGMADVALALSDRFSQDPRLTELTYAVLTQITSIRTFAEILKDYPDLETQERLRFSRIIATQSGDLGSSARAMIDLLDADRDAPRPTMPAHEVDDFMIACDNHFPRLEEEADRLRVRLAPASRSLAAAISERLADAHGVHFTDTATEQDADLADADLADADLADADLADADLADAGHPLDEWAPETTRRFRQARRLVEIEMAELLDEMAENEWLTSDTSRRLGRRALANYAAGALLFPYDPFLEAAEACRYSVERLCLGFGASFEQVAHRLVTLRRRGAHGIPFSFMRSDPAGNISKAFGIPGLRMPRFGGACPLWAIYAAFAAPERTITQLAVMPAGERFLFVARRLEKRSAAFGVVPAAFSVMIGCDATYRQRVVYGDAFAAGSDSLTTPVGFNCLSCPRTDCRQRPFAAEGA